jgi:hypothetical protein
MRTAVVLLAGTTLLFAVLFVAVVLDARRSNAHLHACQLELASAR